MSQWEFKSSNDKEYKFKAILDKMIYIKELKKSYLLGFYLVSWKIELEKKHLKAYVGYIISLIIAQYFL